MKKVFAVTINFNKSEITHNWLTSMKKLSTNDFSLDFIIVDNASETPFSLRSSEQSSQVHVILNKENAGFTGGNNIGIQYALSHGADYILIINNDTIVEKDLVKNLLTVLKRDEKIGATTPKIYFEKGQEFHKNRYKKEELGKVFWYAGGFIDWANVTSIHRGVDEVDHGQYNKEEEVTFASGCCMLIKREVLEKVGLFDDRGFMYYEDAILCMAIQKAGYKIWYVPSAVLWHVNAASSGGSGNGLQDYFLTRNQMLFGMMYAPFRSKVALIRQSFRYIISGRPMQRKGIKDYYLGRFGKGTYFDKKV